MHTYLFCRPSSPILSQFTPKIDRMSSFTHFYETWLFHLHHMVNQLHSSPPPPSTADHHHHLLHLVHRVMSHYTEYYSVKGLAAERDALSIFTAPWATSLERSLHWVAGWRPTTAFHLVYTESSIRFESHIAEILRGLSTGDLGDLSPTQFRRVSELQCETVIFLWKKQMSYAYTRGDACFYL